MAASPPTGPRTPDEPRPPDGPLLLGVDAGQTVTKAALFDLDGREVAVAGAAGVVSTPHPRWQERDLDALWRQGATAIRDCLAAAGVDGTRVAGVGLCGHNDGAYLVDEALRPVRPAILATDSRAHAYVADYRRPAVAERSLAVTGQLPFAGSPAAVLAWLRDHERDAFARTRWVLFCKDWLRLKLTGVVATDPSEASASFTDVHAQSWSKDAFALFGLDTIADRVPPIRGSAEVAGTVTPEAARLTGLAAGTPVVTGAHDVDAAAVGVGAVAVGALSLVMGTFSINQVVGDAPRIDPRWQARSFLRPGQWLHMSTSPAGTPNLDWVLRRLAVLGPDGAEDPAAAVAEAMTSRSPDPPLFLPFLYGSPDGDAGGGSWVGLRGWHDRADLLRAVLEGIVFNHRTHVDALRERFALAGPARLCGGGARSPEWCGLLTDSLGLPVEVTDAREAGARGAAVLAGVGVGLLPDLDAAAARTVRVVRRHAPDAASAGDLDARYTRYRAVASALAALGD